MCVVKMFVGAKKAHGEFFSGYGRAFELFEYFLVSEQTATQAYTTCDRSERALALFLVVGRFVYLI